MDGPLVRRRTLLGIGLAAGGALAAAVAPSPSPSPPSPSPSLLPAPPAEPAPTLTRADVDHAVAGLDRLVADNLARTGVPGAAVAVVYDDKVLYLKGFGVRRVGTAGAVDPDTRFQLASVSKPIGSTVVAALVGDGRLRWDDPIRAHAPEAALSDPWVSEHVTVADMFAHRSGLPDHGGDALEDLGYDRAYILSHLPHLPLAPFRSSYAYTNFGLTAGAVAAATAAGGEWSDVAAERLYGPLGMSSTSSRFADFANAPNHAATHVRTPAGWRPLYVRDPDAQSPAGGVSSTARDLTAWMRLQLAGGRLGTVRHVDEAALAATRLPQSIANPPRALNGRAGFYGLGWDTDYDDLGRIRLSHSGAFALGAATQVTLLPTEGLGIAVLTNSAPIGVPETIALTFMDVAQHGRATVDWAPLLTKVIGAMMTAGRSPTDYANPPAHPAKARADSAYVGTYANDYYGPMVVASMPGAGMAMALGPKTMTFPLTHYDGDTFSYVTRGENAVGRSGVTFADGTVTVENLNHDAPGVFRKS